MISSFQSGDPHWGIGPPSDNLRLSHAQSEWRYYNSNTYSPPSPSFYTINPLYPTIQQNNLLSLNPLATSFEFAETPSFFHPPRSFPSCLFLRPPAFVDKTPFIYQQQIIDRQQQILVSINKRKAPFTETMASFNLPTGQPAPNAFQYNNNPHGFPPSLANLQNTSQDSANSNDSFRTQVPLPWNLPSDYEDSGGVEMCDPSPFAEPPPFVAPDFSNGRAQFQPFANQNSMVSGASARAYGHENEYQMQQQQAYQQENFAMGLNDTNGMHGMNSFSGANNAYQSPPYNGQIRGPSNPHMGTVHTGNLQHQHQNQFSFNGHGGSPSQPNFQQQNMGMRPQLPQIATQFPTNPYSPQYNQTYSAPPIGMNPAQFYNSGGGSNYHGPNSTPSSASRMLSNLKFSNLSLGGMSPNGVGPNGIQNVGYGHGSGVGNIGNTGGIGHNGSEQNRSNGSFSAVANNNNMAANARNAQYTSLASVGNIHHPLPPKPQFQAQNTHVSKPNTGNQPYTATSNNPRSVVHTPQQQKRSLQSEESEPIQESSNGIQSPVSSNGRPLSAAIPASEPRPNFTPLLRSNRGTSITASVDRAQHINDWVQNTPTRGSASRQSSVTSENFAEIDNTPTMPNYDDGREHCPINGSHDAIPGGFTPRALSVNPFNPVTTLAPFSPNSRYGDAGGMSPLLRELTRNGTVTPTAEEALDMRFMPFEEYCRQAKLVQYGVMRIKNIPYGVTRQEILAFLGRNAKIAASNDHEPIHIIMERVTSKTLDAYVEFVSFTEASNAITRFDMNRMGGRGGRLGQRHVEVELSSQEELMKQLFPKAKNVEWHGNKPTIIERDENDKYNSGFQGFVSREELVMLVKHVESPQRSPFSKDCPQRPFECLVSTLIKFPWAMVNHVTCQDRELLYKATMQLLGLLVERVDNNDDPVNLNAQLLKRVWRTALKCEGFSPCMKDNIVYKMKIDPTTAFECGVPPQADLWSNIWTIGPRKDVAYDLVQYYVKLIHDATTEKKQLTLAEKAAARAEEVPRLPSLFGNLDTLVDYTNCLDLTLAELAVKEWAAFETAIRRALTPALEARPSS
ncbi:uncharacterized protein EAE97_002046 [Botrytis byssoidea]|uniref:RRM domain-containing protein n=1 Tax=Botrytis byssoidea TaxID=139641 RepID=A0A9P5M833_9HELO|nr:uncharacterized protein EAE97_002046 [Botrytis byssoidea]KAF7952549.1 hypothetical protein EAE97_002046 [Botrytis byssoidea]